MQKFSIEFENKTYTVKQLISKEKIALRVEEIAKEINLWVEKNIPLEQGNQAEPVTVLIVLHGAILFAADLIRHFKFATEIQTVRLKSYHGTSSCEKIECIGGLPNLAQKHVLVIEDIIDTGRSIEFLKTEILKMAPKTFKISALLDKPEAHAPEFSADYCGFKIGKNFVIGYGLDLNGKYRNLPYVGEMILD
jgi:hypoxanthine phosphoribosyltransferase